MLSLSCSGLARGSGSSMARIIVPNAGVAANVKLSVALMHADWAADRRATVAQLQRALGAPTYPNLERFELVKAIKGKGVWHTAKRAWLSHYRAPRATHHLVIQDDVELCSEFLEGVHRVIAARPEHPICLYANRKVVDEVRAQGKHWAVIPDGAWGQALVLPSRDVPRFLNWCDDNIAPEYPHDDDRLAIWCLYERRPVWCPVPSLVEHAAPAASLLGHSNSNRVARWFAGSSVNVLDINWSDTQHVVGAAPTFKGVPATWPGALLPHVSTR